MRPLFLSKVFQHLLVSSERAQSGSACSVRPGVVLEIVYLLSYLPTGETKFALVPAFQG